MTLFKSTFAAAILASTALSSPVAAQSSEPLILESSSSSSAPGLLFLPYAVALGFGLTIDDFEMKYNANGEILAANTAEYWDLIFYWRLAEAASSLTMVQLGYYNINGDVDTVTQNNGTTFNTSGSMKEQGIFLGVLHSIALASFITADSLRPDRNLHYQPKISGAISVGYGEQDFSAFNNAFTGKDEGVFLRAELGAEIPLNMSRGQNRSTRGVHTSFNPRLVYTHYAGDDISSDNLTGVVGLKFDF